MVVHRWAKTLMMLSIGLDESCDVCICVYIQTGMDVCAVSTSIDVAY